MTLDPRLNAYRSDLADEKLRGKVMSTEFISGKIHRVSDPVAAIHVSPTPNAGLISQALYGTRVRVFDEREGWAWGQCENDGYVGYLPVSALSSILDDPTHRVSVLSSYLYTAPDIKAQPVVAVYLNSHLAIVVINGDFAQLADGRFIWARHICPITEFVDNPADIAEEFEHVPYLWGGGTQAGLDCSGLVQTSFAACGKLCPRDSDMMEQGLGKPLLINDLAGLTRGDLVFWKGHVGMMLDDNRLIHANGYHMTTVVEPLQDAVQRIEDLFGPMTGTRRP